jgi:hypothetical protein
MGTKRHTGDGKKSGRKKHSEEKSFMKRVERQERHTQKISPVKGVI